MRLTLALQSLAAMAVAMPAAHPQEIDINMVLAAPDPIVYDPAVGATAQAVSYDFSSLVAQATAAVASIASDVSATATTINKRGEACTSLAAGASGAPVVSPDTPAAFASNSGFPSLASNAPVPTGYSNAFTNLNASASAYGYLGFTTLSTYDTAKCAANCDAIYGCLSFNLYFERDPSVDPGSGASGCENPASVTYIKCVYWGSVLSRSNMDNHVQWRNKFQVVIAGSNGYTNTTLAAPAGYSDAIYYGTLAINATLDAQGFNTFIASTIFTGPFDVGLCAAACDAQTQRANNNPAADGTPPKTCQFFNTYILNLNDNKHPQGQYCSMYTEAWPSKYATSTGSTTSSGDKLVVGYSYGYINKNNPGIDPTKGDRIGAIYQASGDIKSNSSFFQPFCSSYLGYSAPLITITSTTTVAPVATSTSYATTTVQARRKRDDGDDSDYFPGLTTNSTDAIAAVFDSNNNVTWYLPLDSITSDSSVAAATSDSGVAKRDVSTPGVLTKYPGTVISAACSMQVSLVTVASTVVINETTTIATSTTVVDSVATVTAAASTESSSVSSSSSSLTSSSTSSPSSSAASSTSSPSSSTANPSATSSPPSRLVIINSGTSADGDELELDSGTSGYSPVYLGYYATSTSLHGSALTPNFTLNATTGYLRDNKYNYVLSVYNSLLPGTGLAYSLYFFPESKLKSNGYIPVICSGTTELSCQAKNSWGTVLSKLFLHPELGLDTRGYWSLSLGDGSYNLVGRETAAGIGFQ